MKKEIYQEPVIELLLFEQSDIITTSKCPGYNYGEHHETPDDYVE